MASLWTTSAVLRFRVLASAMAAWLHETGTFINVIVLIYLISVGSELYFLALLNKLFVLTIHRCYNRYLAVHLAMPGYVFCSGLAQLRITNPPQDATAVERGNATFLCAGEENGMAVIIGWRFSPSGSAASVVLITGTSLTGIEMVTVSDGLRTMVTHLVKCGGTVMCTAFGSSGSLDSGPATLTVLSSVSREWMWRQHTCWSEEVYSFLINMHWAVSTLCGLLWSSELGALCPSTLQIPLDSPHPLPMPHQEKGDNSHSFFHLKPTHLPPVTTLHWPGVVHPSLTQGSLSPLQVWLLLMSLVMTVGSTRLQRAMLWSLISSTPGISISRHCRHQHPCTYCLYTIKSS